MGEQTGNVTPKPGGAEPPPPPPPAGADKVAEVMAELVSNARVDAVFGQPHTVGDRTVITAAEVMCGCGFGFGSGDSAATGEKPAGRGSGGGGGGGVRSRPIAAIVVEPGGVKIQPIMDLTQVTLAGMAAGIFVLFWAVRMIRGRRETDKMPVPPRSFLKMFRP